MCCLAPSFYYDPLKLYNKMVRIHSSNIVLLSLGLLLLALSIQPASASPQSVVATTRVPPIREPSAKPPGTRLLNETENDLILSDWSHHSRRLAATKLWDVTFSSSVNSG